MEQLQLFRTEISEFRSVCNRTGMECMALLFDAGVDASGQVKIRRAVETLRQAYQSIAKRQDIVLRHAAPTVRETLSTELFTGIELGHERIVEQLRLLGDCLARRRRDPRRHDGAQLVGAELNRLIGTDLSNDVATILSAVDDCLATSEVAQTSLAFTDELTGLPNRRALYAMADRLWQGTKTIESFILLRFDLDRFKQINDSHGHAAGDAALSRAADIMRETITADDFVARVGGDEFVMLLGNQEDASAASQQTEELIARISAPFDWAGESLSHGMSVGLVPVKKGQEISLDRLLHESDIALYAAKSAGRGQHLFYSEHMLTQRTVDNTLFLEIEAGLERGEFVPYFQPQVEGRTGRLAGVEALARWMHPTRGVLSPYHFLQTIEQRNLSQTLDRTISQLAFDAFRRWQANGLHVPCISVNVSANRLQNPYLGQELVDLAAEFSIPHDYISLEILETAMIDASNVEIINNARRLSELGFRIELDDFGTGHASVANLRHFHVDRIKIDKSFIRSIDMQADLAKITTAIIGLAHSLRVDALAEGVETPEERLILNALGCDQIQGFGVARPMPSDEFEAWVARTQSQRELDLRELLPAKSA